MDTPVAEIYVDNGDELEPHRVIAAWCEAITGLFMYYNALQALLINQSTRRAYIGQCPVYQLVQLGQTMHNELENLEQDLERLPKSTSSTSQQAFKKLAAHTVVLNQLNGQATIKLRLAQMPAC